MPTPLGDTLPSFTVLSSSSLRHNQHLPSHRDAQFPHSQELDDLSKTGGQRHNIDRNSSATPPQSSGSLHEDAQHLLSGEDSAEEDEDIQNPNSMGAKSRRPKPLEPNGSTPNGGQNGHANGHPNGQANGRMNNSVEYRRKNASIDSPAVTANLMSRDSFSLDEHVPKTPTLNNHGFFQLPIQDRRNFGLLVLLYFLQGVPMGLATGSVPFLLKPHMSYSALGVFSLASYPYSLKLLWSPVVDAVWSPKLGRRKSWIMPIQILSGIGMLWLGARVKTMMVEAGANDGAGIWSFTGWWFFLVFMCATQDIAVDGWALTLLSPGNISYASTAQTV